MSTEAATGGILGVNIDNLKKIDEVLMANEVYITGYPVRSKYSKRFYDTVQASVSEACTGRPRPAKPCTSHLSSHVIIRVLHRQVFCVSDVVQLHVGGDEDELADSAGRQLSMDD